MKEPKIDLNNIPEPEQTVWVIRLLRLVQKLRDEIHRMKEEIARLKQPKGKPKMLPSQLEKAPPRELEKNNAPGKRPGSEKRSKTKELIIHETIPVPPKEIPPGSTRESHHDWIVQGLKINVHNVCYQLECWLTPEGNLIQGELPASVNGHFDATLRSFILHQHNHGHVTQPLIREELVDLGVDISTGQVNRILTETNEEFHAEKNTLLGAGLAVSKHIHVDDTGARHAGKNGYCTHIGNEYFAWFESTDSKSRINFLNLLRQGHHDYRLNEDALEYLRRQSFPQPLLERLATADQNVFDTEEDWKKHLEQGAIIKDRQVRIATEGALLGSVLHHGFSKELVILSDDAGQFNVFLHALCWVHAERTIHKLVPWNEGERKAIEDVRDHIWQLYRGLKDYKQAPDPEARVRLATQFDDLFATPTCSQELNDALQRIAKNKDELLLVLERPDIPLNNNLSERDIREYVKKRKISGSTRSEAGRRCRDTFTSLKKTCRKLGISFWAYLLDRVSKTNNIAPLSYLIRVRAASP